MPVFSPASTLPLTRRAFVRALALAGASAAACAGLGLPAGPLPTARRALADGADASGATGAASTSAASTAYPTIVWPDPSIDGFWPQDPTPASEFYAWACRDWMVQNPEIPQGRSSWSVTTQISETVRARLIDLLADPGDGHDGQLAGALFASGLDWDARNAAGLEPLRPLVGAILEARTLDELTEVIATSPLTCIAGGLVSVDVGSDDHDSTLTALFVSPAALVMGDSSEYAGEPSETGARYRDSFRTAGQALLERFGLDAQEASGRLDQFFALETLLAPDIYPASVIAGSDSLEFLYNPYTPDELASLCPSFPLARILQAAGLDEPQRAIVTQPAALAALDAAYTARNLELFKGYFSCKLLMWAARYADAASEADYLERANTNSGATGVLADDQRVLSAIDDPVLARELIGRVYFSSCFGEEARADVTDIARAYLDAFGRRIEACDWLGEQTRAQAAEKLATMTLNIAAPSSYLVDWDAVELPAGACFLQNALYMAQVTMRAHLARVGRPVDRGIWRTMGSHTVNAFYDPSTNSMNFPAGFLEAPYYSRTASRIANLGGIGQVIGHELTHGFDSIGSQYDKDGNLRSWWTDEDRAAFDLRTNTVSAYYSSIEVLDGEHVRGDAVLGEATADLGALACTVDILHDGSATPEDFAELFRAFAANKAERITAAQAMYNLKYDAHPLGYLRANVTVQQFQEFYDAFGVEEGDFMYLAPEKRLSVW